MLIIIGGDYDNQEKINPVLRKEMVEGRLERVGEDLKFGMRSGNKGNSSESNIINFMNRPARNALKVEVNSYS